MHALNFLNRPRLCWLTSDCLSSQSNWVVNNLRWCCFLQSHELSATLFDSIVLVWMCLIDCYLAFSIFWVVLLSHAHANIPNCVQFRISLRRLPLWSILIRSDLLLQTLHTACKYTSSDYDVKSWEDGQAVSKAFLFRYNRFFFFLPPDE